MLLKIFEGIKMSQIKSKSRSFITTQYGHSFRIIVVEEQRMVKAELLNTEFKSKAIAVETDEFIVDYGMHLAISNCMNLYYSNLLDAAKKEFMGMREQHKFIRDNIRKRLFKISPKIFNQRMVPTL